MSHVHKKPISRTDKKFDIGFFEDWKLNKIDSFKVSHHTVAGGREKILECKDDRVLIVVKGFATNLDTNQVIRDGDVIEIPAGSTFHYRGQLKYYEIRSK